MSSVFTNTRLLGGAAAPSHTRPAAQVHQELQAEVLSLHAELHRRLLRYSMSFGLSRHDSEDVLQEVFLALFRHLQLGRSRENLRGWLFRTAHNLTLRQRIRIHRERRYAANPDDDGHPHPVHLDLNPGPEENLLFRERQYRLAAVLRCLPENDQNCLRLRAEGLRYREIASALGISLGSVAASLARSLARLERMDAR